MHAFVETVREATQAMRTVFPATPLLHNAHLSQTFGAEIYLKREDLSPVRSYKLRGAFNAMRAQPDAPLFVCASAGNHAQGVAYMCQHFGKRGVIFMPVTTPQQKIQKTRMFGGQQIEIRLIGDYFDDCLRAAQAFCAKEGGHFLSPFDDDDVIVGQASVAEEIQAQLGAAPDHIVVPVGGGGLSAGVLSYFGTDVQYTFVEPAGGACLRAA
ncbi:MAG: pyridoxal-phosphate dependent enzyme, partial [Halocynthiibacter sp.]